MKIASIVLASVTTLMVLSQLTCGLWLQAHGADPEGVAFHARLGIGSIVMSLVTIAVMLVFVLKH